MFPRLIFVDLDHTLVQVDTFKEVCVRLIFKHPWRFLSITLRHLLSGFYLGLWKKDIAARESLDITALPYNPHVLAILTRAQREGAEVVLATASPSQIAHKVAKKCALFSHILSTERKENLIGTRKLKAMQAYAGPRPFTYIGDSKRDLEIFPSCETSIIVGSLPFTGPCIRLPPNPPILSQIYGIFRRLFSSHHG